MLLFDDIERTGRESDEYADYAHYRIPFTGPFDRRAFTEAIESARVPHVDYRGRTIKVRLLGFASSISSLTDNGDSTVSLSIRHFIGD